MCKKIVRSPKMDLPLFSLEGTGEIVVMNARTGSSELVKRDALIVYLVDISSTVSENHMVKVVTPRSGVHFANLIRDSKTCYIEVSNKNHSKQERLKLSTYVSLLLAS